MIVIRFQEGHRWSGGIQLELIHDRLRVALCAAQDRPCAFPEGACSLIEIRTWSASCLILVQCQFPFNFQAAIVGSRRCKFEHDLMAGSSSLKDAQNR